MEFKQQIDAESSFLEMMAFSFSNFVAEKTQNPEPTKSLTCPRCDSSNTKFCYYNNYKLTQPRHFCKSCKRYWTRGGSLRVVPIGGGCRKNKKSKHDSKAERQTGACNRGESVEDRRKKIMSTSAATTTSSGNNSCMTNATVFSSSESSGSDAKLAKNVIEICASPGEEEELVDLPSHVAKVRIPQSGSSTTSGVLFTVCTPKEQGAGVSFHEQQISRNPVISVVNTHKLKSKSNSLFLGRQDFSSSDPLVLDNTNPYFTDSTSLDAALLAAANFSNSQWLDQIAIHNNETGYASQIVGKPIHSKCTFSPVSQVENIFLPSVGTDLINCSEPHWRIQSNRCQQVLLASLAHADHLVETSKSDVGNTIPERQWGSGGFSSCEPCYMQDDAGVLNHFHPFDVKSGF